MTQPATILRTGRKFDQVLQGARQVFMADGFEGASVDDIAKAAGITREALYKALRPGSAPRFDTVNRVCTALGVRLVVQPLHPV